MWLIRALSLVRSLIFLREFQFSFWIHLVISLKHFLMIQIYRKGARKVEEYVNFLYPESTNANILPHLLYHLSLIFFLNFLKLNTGIMYCFPQMSIFQIITAHLGLGLEKYFSVYFLRILHCVFPKFVKTFSYMTTV